MRDIPRSFSHVSIDRSPAGPDPGSALAGPGPQDSGQQEVTQMPEASFAVEVVSGVPVVTAPEEIDVTNATGLRAALLEAAAQGSRTLVVDMAQTQFCDSAGLNVLV